MIIIIALSLHKIQHDHVMVCQTHFPLDHQSIFGAKLKFLFHPETRANFRLNFLITDLRCGTRLDFFYIFGKRDCRLPLALD